MECMLAFVELVIFNWFQPSRMWQWPRKWDIWVFWLSFLSENKIWKQRLHVTDNSMVSLSFPFKNPHGGCHSLKSLTLQHWSLLDSVYLGSFFLQYSLLSLWLLGLEDYHSEKTLHDRLHSISEEWFALQVKCNRHTLYLSLLYCRSLHRNQVQEAIYCFTLGQLAASWIATVVRTSRSKTWSDLLWKSFWMKKRW